MFVNNLFVMKLSAVCQVQIAYRLLQYYIHFAYIDHCSFYEHAPLIPI